MVQRRKPKPKSKPKTKGKATIKAKPKVKVNTKTKIKAKPKTSKKRVQWTDAAIKAYFESFGVRDLLRNWKRRFFSYLKDLD